MPRDQKKSICVERYRSNFVDTEFRFNVWRSPYINVLRVQDLHLYCAATYRMKSTSTLANSLGNLMIYKYISMIVLPTSVHCLFDIYHVPQDPLSATHDTITPPKLAGCVLQVLFLHGVKTILPILPTPVVQSIMPEVAQHLGSKVLSQASPIDTEPQGSLFLASRRRGAIWIDIEATVTRKIWRKIRKDCIVFDWGSLLKC